MKRYAAPQAKAWGIGAIVPCRSFQAAVLIPNPAAKIRELFA